MPARIIVSSGKSKGQEILIHGKVARLGSANYCDVRLSTDEGIEPVVLNLEFTETSCSLYNVTSRSLRLGDQNILPHQHADWPADVPLVLNPHVTVVLKLSSSSPAPVRSPRKPVLRNPTPGQPLPPSVSDSDTTESEESPDPSRARSNSQTTQIMLIALCILICIAILFWDSEPTPVPSSTTMSFSDICAKLRDLEESAATTDQKNWIRRWRNQLQNARQAKVRGAITHSSSLYRQLYQEAKFRHGGTDGDLTAEDLPKAIRDACEFIRIELRQPIGTTN